MSWPRVGALLLALGLLLPGCNGAAQSGLPKVGRPAPDLTVARLDGGALTVAELRGKAVMLNFWSTTCPPCRAEMPDMQAVYQELADKGAVVVAVDQREGADTVRRFVQGLGLTFPIALDEKGTAGAQYGVTAIPTSVFIDRGGTVRYVRIGQLDKETIRQYFLSLL